MRCELVTILFDKDPYRPRLPSSPLICPYPSQHSSFTTVLSDMCPSTSGADVTDVALSHRLAALSLRLTTQPLLPPHHAAANQPLLPSPSGRQPAFRALDRQQPPPRLLEGEEAERGHEQGVEQGPHPSRAERREGEGRGAAAAAGAAAAGAAAALAGDCRGSSGLGSSESPGSQVEGMGGGERVPPSMPRTLLARGGHLVVKVLEGQDTQGTVLHSIAWQCRTPHCTTLRKATILHCGFTLITM